MKKYLLFVGIDISKKTIDCSITLNGQRQQMNHKKFSNDLEGFQSMISWIKSYSSKNNLVGNWIFCFEYTGVYSIPLSSFFEQHNYDYIIETPLRIKRSIGLRRGKDDKADSMDIARYIYLFHKELKLSKLPSITLLKLKNLLTFRARLLKKLTSLKTPLKELKGFTLPNTGVEIIVEETEEISIMLKKKIKKIDDLLMELIEEDDQIRELYYLITSVKGIGKINAVLMIIHTNCFKAFNCARKFACYIGIAPFKEQSGTSLNKPAKVSHLGHTKLKTYLSSGTLAAIRHDKQLRAYYLRRLEEGKNKFKVINAVKNKLISRVFAVVKRGSPYVELVSYT